MKKLLSTALLALVAAVTVNAQFLFCVKGKGLEQPSYILGSIHTLPGSLLDSIPEYLEAEAACKQLYAEYEVNNEQKMKEVMAAGQQALSLPEGKTLFDVLTMEQLDALNYRFKEVFQVNVTDSAMMTTWHYQPQVFPGTFALFLFLVSSCVIAILGYANALGADPLGFYKNMRESQIPMFYSTIGHFDFYGTFLLLPAAIAYGIVMRSEHLIARLCAFCAAIVLTLGAYAARTDSVWLGMGMIGFSLIFLSGANYRHLSRALLMIAFMIGLFSVSAYVLRNYSTHPLEFSGAYTFMTLRRGGEVVAVFAILSFLALMLHSHDVKVPGYKRLVIIGLIVFLILAILLTCLVVFATRTNDDKALFGLAPTFRMDDNFGSRRGYIWTRSLRAFMAGSPMEKVFGQGLELTKRITRPFIESVEEENLGGGTYNDAHSQPIQILLTCGIFGLVMFLLHYLLLFRSLLRHGENDPLLAGIAAAMAAYLVIMAINVTQPILLVIYIGLSAVAVGRIGALRNRREDLPKEK